MYVATREVGALSTNPLWVGGGGERIRGLGSAHTRNGFVWPLGIAMEGLTATTTEGSGRTLSVRLEATLILGLLFQESLDPADPRRYTRHWFSWADMLYVELVLASAGLVSG